MENKRLLLIAGVLLIGVLLVVALLTFDIFEKQPEEIISEETFISQEVEPYMQRAMEIRETKRIIDGDLQEVGDDYFVISQSFYDGDEDIMLMDIEEQRRLDLRYEYITVRPIELAEIVEINTNSNIVIPPENTRAIDIVNYLYENYKDEYIIRIYFATDQIVEEEIEDKEDLLTEEVETDYIEWSVFPISWQ